MTTDPEMFKRFHQTLVFDHPDFKPHYLELPTGRKYPPNKAWTENPLSFEEAYSLMKNGHNIGLGAMSKDALAILDIDWKGVDMGIAVKPTLSTTSRKRHAGMGHHFYWWTDKRAKHTVGVDDPDDKDKHLGELRADGSYVVVAGSYVEPDKNEWFGTKAEFDALKEKPKPDIEVYILTEAELELLGHYTFNGQHRVIELTVMNLPECFRAVFDKKYPVEAIDRATGTTLWGLTFEQVFKGRNIDPSVLRGETPEARGPSPLHASTTGHDTQFSKWIIPDTGREIVIMKCWGHSCSHSPLTALGVLAGLGSCNELGRPERAGDDYVPQLNLDDDDVLSKLLAYAKEKGILPKDAKKRKKKAAEEKPELTARRVVGNVIYTECRESDHHFFARYDQTTKKVEYVDVIPETGELPYVNPGITYPRRLTMYGTPADLYHEVKEAINYAEAQEGGKNELCGLFLLLHGCVDPYARHNLQMHVVGPASKGKGRYVELCFMMGDRARMTTDLTSATGYRLNELLGGGLEILDEVSDDDVKTEKYIRAKYDPIGAQQRLLDPKSTNAIEGFRVSGPTLVSKRTAFEDDANIDRGVVLMCEQGARPYPLELIKRDRYINLRDRLAMFWVEHYGDATLLPTEEEMMYDPSKETTEPRLRMAQHYFTKLARMIGAEAIADLSGFVEEQVRARRELKAVTDEGAIMRVLHGLIVDRVDGYHHRIDRDDGSHHKVVDTLAIEPGGPGRYIIAITRTPEDGGADKDSWVFGISWNYIAKLANLASRREPGRILLPYSVRQVQKRIAGRVVRTVSFRLDRLDEAFRAFLPEYAPEWKKPFLEIAEQRGVGDFSSTPSQQDPLIDSQQGERNGETAMPASPSVPVVPVVPVCSYAKLGQNKEEGARQEGTGIAYLRSGTSGTIGTNQVSGSSSSDKLSSQSDSSVPSTTVNGHLDTLQEDLFNKQVLELQERVAPRKEEFLVNALQDAIQWVACTYREDRVRPDTHSLRQVMLSTRVDLKGTPVVHPSLKNWPTYATPQCMEQVKKMLDFYGPKILELGKFFYKLGKGRAP